MSPEETKRFDDWLDRFTVVMAKLLDESMEFQRNAQSSPDYGFDLSVLMGGNWKEKRQASLQGSIRQALMNLIESKPDFANRVLSARVDPEAVALAVAPQLAADLRQLRFN